MCSMTASVKSKDTDGSGFQNNYFLIIYYLYSVKPTQMTLLYRENVTVIENVRFFFVDYNASSVASLGKFRCQNIDL